MCFNQRMKRILCPACEGKTKRNGKTSSGAQRWRCTSCGASTTQRYNKTTKLFELFLAWLLSKDLMHVEDLNAATSWLVGFSNWCTCWDEFLKEKTVIDNKRQYKHERLRKARRGLEKLARQGTLFTYLDEDLVKDGSIPATNNRIEGGVNRQLRVVLREHRGLSLTRRIKAVFWWCYTHTENPLSAAEILQEMPTDESIAELYRAASKQHEKDVAVEQWGTAVSWSDLHKGDSFRIDWD